MRVIVHRRSGRPRSAPGCRTRSGLGAGAALREEVAAEERARRSLHHEAALPAVRHVRRVEPLERVASPVGSISPSASARAGRSATSFTDTIAATWLQTGARRARRRGSRSAPRIRLPRSGRRRRSAGSLSGSTLPIASATSGNRRRGPVWKSSGSSSATRYWLKLKRPARDLDRRVDAVDARGDLVEVGAAGSVGEHGFLLV